MGLINHFKGKVRWFKGAIFFTGLLAFMGCQGYLLPARIDLEQVDQKEYRVAVYEGLIGDPAVVFDVVEDDLDIELYSYRAREEGLRPSEGYVRWISGIGYFSAYEVKDRGGEVRGYLLISKNLRFTIRYSKKEERIRVEIEDPFEGDGIGPRLRRRGPERFK